MKEYIVLLSVLLSTVLAVPRKYVDGHPQIDSWGKLAPAQAAEAAQNEQRTRQNRLQYGGNGQLNPYIQGYPQAQPLYNQAGQYGSQYYQQGYGQQNWQQYAPNRVAGYNQYGAGEPTAGKFNKKNGENINSQGFGQFMRAPIVSMHGQGQYGQQNHYFMQDHYGGSPQYGMQDAFGQQLTGQCVSPCSQACAPACSSQCCGVNNAYTARQLPPSMTQSSCPGACPNSCAPSCSQKCCWDKRTMIPRPAFIPRPYEQYYNQRSDEYEPDIHPAFSKR